MKKLSESKKAETKISKASIKGKQILIGGLVVLVAVAGYYRYSMGNTVPKGESLEPSVPVMSTAKTVTENYFDVSRQERDSARSEAENLLTQIVEDEEVTADAKAEAREKLKASAENIKTEADIEGLVKAKDYDDCIVFIDEEEIRIIVKAKELDEDKVSQITEIATSKTDFKPSQIIISNHK